MATVKKMKVRRRASFFEKMQNFMQKLKLFSRVAISATNVIYISAFPLRLRLSEFPPEVIEKLDSQK
jgi:hypothetical protein